MKLDFEIIEEAKKKFSNYYKQRIRMTGFYLAAGVGESKTGELMITALVQFTGKGLTTQKKKEVEKIIPRHFSYKGNHISVDLKYARFTEFL